MVERWLGISASKDSLVIVDATIPDDDDPITINSDDTWRLQSGDRSEAYTVLYHRCSDFIRENKFDVVVIKASAVSGKGPANLGLLSSAEVRGVVMAAAAENCRVVALSKAHISKTYGERKVDEYVADDSFWIENTIGGDLRKLSRETAMMLIAARDL